MKFDHLIKTFTESLAEGRAYDPHGDFDVMYRVDVNGRLMQRNYSHAQVKNAWMDGYFPTAEEALRKAGIIRSKFDPKKFVKKGPEGKWVQAFPYGQPNQ